MLYLEHIITHIKSHNSLQIYAITDARKIVRERDRDRERQRQTETDRQTETETDRRERKYVSCVVFSFPSARDD